MFLKGALTRIERTADQAASSANGEKTLGIGLAVRESLFVALKLVLVMAASMAFFRFILDWELKLAFQYGLPLIGATVFGTYLAGYLGEIESLRSNIIVGAVKLLLHSIWITPLTIFLFALPVIIYHLVIAGNSVGEITDAARELTTIFTYVAGIGVATLWAIAMLGFWNGKNELRDVAAP